MSTIRSIVAKGDALVVVPLSLIDEQCRFIEARQDGVVIVYPDGATPEDIADLVAAAERFQVAASG